MPRGAVTVVAMRSILADRRRRLARVPTHCISACRTSVRTVPDPRVRTDSRGDVLQCVPRFERASLSAPSPWWSRRPLTGALSFSGWEGARTSHCPRFSRARTHRRTPGDHSTARPASSSADTAARRLATGSTPRPAAAATSPSTARPHVGVDRPRPRRPQPARRTHHGPPGRRRNRPRRRTRRPRRRPHVPPGVPAASPHAPAAASPAGTPSNALRRLAFSAAFAARQTRTTSSTVSARLVAEHVRVPPGHLVADPAATSSRSNVPRAGGDPRVQDHLVEHVAEFLADVVRVAVVDGVDEFVGLLDGVARERGVGLRPVPHAPAVLGEQAVDDGHEVRYGGHLVIVPPA